MRTVRPAPGGPARSGPGAVALFVALVLGSILVGCSDGTSEPPTADRDRGAAAIGGRVVESDPTAGDGDRSASGSGAAASDDRAEVVEGDCYGTETRCGVVLVPQVPGSADLVGIGFREWTDRRDGPPLVILEWDGPTPLDGDDFPGRPVVVIGGRDRWPGGPGIECPAFDRVTTEPTPAEVEALARECRTWLEDAGIDLAGASRDARVGDVATTVVALGHDSVAIVAAGVEAEVVAGLSGLVDIERAVYVNPDFLVDATGRLPANTLLDAVEEGWRQCEAAPTCEPVGSVDDLFTAVAALDDDPLPHPWDEDRVIDAAELLAGMQGFPGQPHLVASLPELHRALLDRDADTVNRFLASVFDTGTIHHTVTGCQRIEAPAALDGAPAVLEDHLARTMARRRALCGALEVEPSTGFGTWPGLIVETRSAGGGDADREEIGPVIVEPTVGWPSAACLVGAIAAWVDDGAVDDAACRSGIRFATRDDPIVPVPTTVQDGAAWAVAVVVPEGWGSPWSGYWARRADIRDDTSLSIYSWEADDPEAVLEDLIWEYDLVDPVRSQREDGDRTWYLARGPSYDGELHEVLAVVEIDGVIVVVELVAEPGAVDETIRLVLEPAMASVAIEWTGD